MEFPEPEIDVEAAAGDLRFTLPIAGDARTGEDAGFVPALRALLAQAWEEGRWSLGSSRNPYGAPAASIVGTGTPGLRVLALRSAAQAALAWLENMAPTARRTALAEQLRKALGEK